MLTIRNFDTMVQIGDSFANYRLMRSYVIPASSFTNGAGIPGEPLTPPVANINTTGIDSPLVVIRAYNADHRGSVSMWWGSSFALLYGKVKSYLYQVEVFIFGKTSVASNVEGPKLLMRNAAGVVEYDSRHIPFVVADFVRVEQIVPVGQNEIDLGQFLTGKGLGVCMIGPRTNYHRTNPQTAWVDIESIRMTTDNHVWLSNIRMWDISGGSYFAPGDFDMSANPFYLMFVDVDKLPLPYEGV